MDTKSFFVLGLLISALLLIGPQAAVSGPNPNFTLPLHAAEGTGNPCSGYLPVDCLGHRPAVNVAADSPVTVYLLLMNYDNVHALETAFAWDAGWVFMGGAWDCQVNQIFAVQPHDPGGPTAGTIATAFNCINGPALAVIGRMFFLSGANGCLRQVESTYPDGTAVLDCTNAQLDYIDANTPEGQQRLGRICVGTGGRDACDPTQTTATEPATWGTIKATYR
jgi:hypothetical protein